MRRKVSGAVVDERRDPSATGRGPRRPRGGTAAATRRRPRHDPRRDRSSGAAGGGLVGPGVARGEGWMGVGEVGLFGAVDLAVVISV